MIKSLIFVITLLIIWVIVTSLNLIDPVFIPGPLYLWESFLKLSDVLPIAILYSVSMALGGFGIGCAFGISMGLLMAYSKNFFETVGPVIDFTRPIPIFALIPLFLLWFGSGMLAQLLFIALGVSALLGVSTYEAIKNIPSIYIRSAGNLGAKKRRIYRTVILPWILPHLIGAIRIAAAASWGLNVAAEFMGAQIGLGYNMIIQQIYLSTSGIIVIVIIYSILAIIFDRLILKIETKVTAWTEREISSAVHETLFK